MLKNLIDVSTLSQLQRHAEHIGSSLCNNDVIFLEGPLGAGKTTFSQFLINHCCKEKVQVTSPTFSLVNMYETPLFPIWHFDLYRLEKPEELFQIGLEEALEDGVLLIEWPNRGHPLLPDPTLRLRFLTQGQERLLEVTSQSG